MVHDYEYFKKRYKIFIRFLKENNLYEEYRNIIEKNICICIEQYNARKKNIHKWKSISYTDGSC